MLNLRVLLLTVLVTSLLGGISSPGCADDPANVELTDAADGCGAEPERLEQPLALRSELDIRLTVDGDGGVAVKTVTSSDPAIIGVETVANPFVVSALAVGSSQVAVEAEGGVKTSVVLAVAAPEEALVSPDPMTLYNLDIALGTPHPDATAEHLAKGLVLLSGGELQLGVVLRDAQGRELIGHGGAAWASSEPDLVMSRPDSRRNDVTLTHSGLSAVATLTTVASGRYDVTLADAATAPTLAVWLPSAGVFTDALTLAEGETRTVVLVGREADDKLILDASGFTVQSADTAIANVVAPPWAEPNGDVELDAEGEAFLARARVMFINGAGVGQTTVTLTALGQRLDLPVSVVE